MKVPMQVPSGNTVALSSLAVGEAFFYNSAFFIKTDDSTKNACGLADGILITVPIVTQVTPAAVKVDFD